MLEHAGARDRAILGDMANQDHRAAAFLGIADQLLRRGAHLADRARRALDQVAVHRLDRIDHQHHRRFHAAQRGQDVAHRCCRGEIDRRVGQPQAQRAQPHLIGRLLAADIDDRVPCARHVGRGLEQQGRLADARIAAHQRRRSRDQPAAQRAVELGNAGRDARRQLDRGIQPGKLDALPAGLQVVPGRESGGRGLFGKRVPLAAIGALALPAVGDAATGLTDIGFARLGHGGGIARTKLERNCRFALAFARNMDSVATN